MKIHKSIIGIVILFFLFLTGYALLFMKASNKGTVLAAESVPTQKISSVLSADGTVHSVSEVTLNFQIGGKLVYLPFKEGDQVSQGATIAQLDTYSLQRQLTQALNTYQSTRDTFDQTTDNNTNNILQGQQSFMLRNSTDAGLGGQQEVNVINDAAKRILDQNQTTLDNSVINVELANYSLQLATLSTPIDGVLTHEDVSVPNVNITPQTTFAVADPTNLVFKANVSENDIDFVSVGATATIRLNGTTDTIPGTITKIYPEKTVTTDGQNVYIVDVTSDGLTSVGKLGQTGTVLIKSNSNHDVRLVPTWAVLSHNSIWVEQNSHPVLKKVVIGKNHGDKIEVLSGLAEDDAIITDPQYIAKLSYEIL